MPVVNVEISLAGVGVNPQRTGLMNQTGLETRHREHLADEPVGLTSSRMASCL
jgi:hypothetical protein